LLTNGARHQRGGRQTHLVLGDVEVGFVERQRLDQVCMTLEDFPDTVRSRPVTREIRSDEDRTGTQAFRLHGWHGGVNSESSGLVGSGTNDRTLALPGNDHGLA